MPPSGRYFEGWSGFSRVKDADAPPSAVAGALRAWPSLTRLKPSRAWGGSRDGRGRGRAAGEAGDGGTIGAMRAPRAPRGTRHPRGRAGRRRSEAKTRSDGARGLGGRAQRRAGAQAQAQAQAQAGRGGGCGGRRGSRPFPPPTTCAPRAPPGRNPHPRLTPSPRIRPAPPARAGTWPPRCPPPAAPPTAPPWSPVLRRPARSTAAAPAGSPRTPW